MSSHHFVKEGQEPALFILDGDVLEAMVELLEWAPLVMVSYNALNKVLELGIKIDVLLLPTNDLNLLTTTIANQAPLKLVIYDSNESWFDKGLEHLAKSNYSAVNILVESFEKFSQTLNIEDGGIQKVIFDRTCKWSLSQRQFEKWLPSNLPIKIEKTTAEQSLTLKNLRQVENDYLTEHEGIAQIYSDNPFWVGETL